MIISIEWLKKFVDIKENPEELAELLTNVGLEEEPTNFPLYFHLINTIIFIKDIIC